MPDFRGLPVSRCGVTTTLGVATSWELLDVAAAWRQWHQAGHDPGRDMGPGAPVLDRAAPLLGHVERAIVPGVNRLINGLISAN